MDQKIDIQASVASHSSQVGSNQTRNQSWVSTSTLRRKSADIHLVGRHSEVYEPCDDSFALVDALLADRVHLEEVQPSLCLEVGCGSGYVITSLALMLGQETGIRYLATDISAAAIEVTQKTLAAHGVHADVLLTDLVSGLDKRLAGTVDVLVVNPPYVPTSEEEVGVNGITASWAGGENGRAVIDRILAIANDLLSSKGWFYLVTLTANNPAEICLIMRQKGFASRIIVQRSTEEESLHVLKFWRDPSEITTEIGTSPPQSLTRRLSRLAFWKSS
uniref:TSA: Wollemia nobilis Ref_Wollemi_Transcript_11509_974 transcribed RNA sequence n=1 Tax=Wollemia nobilis TaxID=56998 RepID=A0A0C9S8D3_9CONI